MRSRMVLRAEAPAHVLHPHAHPRTRRAQRTRDLGRPSAAATSLRTAKIPCVPSWIVSWSPFHSASAPCGSIAECNALDVVYFPRTTTSASRNPLSTSPREWTIGDDLEMLSP